ncbi:MAG TPA: protein translocase subunit SecF [Pseudonocardiaceae bacterium]|jgi:preprotein translocase subunit SecF|nr:protein translocase subunit SecF [Pseudonocardiaceae bacterium]
MSTSTLSSPDVKKQGLFYRLYTGTGAFDLVGKRKRFYAIFASLVLICLVGIFLRPFNFTIDFVGGTQIEMPAHGTHGTIDINSVKSAFDKALGQEPTSVVTVGNGSQATIQIQSGTLTNTQTSNVEADLFNQFQPVGTNGKASLQVVSDSSVSGSWGSQISSQAVYGLIAFLVLVAIFLAIYFERTIATAAIIALANDLIVTAGVYAWVGFTVSPATIIGGLTILGFSLYDAVVVFDKVKENTRGLLGLTRQTYGEATNLALNQTLMRSINTSLIALLPVLGLLVVGVGILGVGELNDLALVQLIGMLSGAASSLFLATPLAVDFKMRDPKYQQQAKRVASRREHLAKKAAERAAQGVTEPEAAARALTQDDLDEDAAYEAELRKEKAYAASASTPSRTPKRTQQNRTGRPTGKSSRSTGGKRRH